MKLAITLLHKDATMYTHLPTIFNELLSFLPFKTFDSLVGQHKVNRYRKNFSAKNLLLILLYAQITWKDSLRDIETSLSVHSNHYYHLGIQSTKRSTIAYNNSLCNYQVFEQTFYTLLQSIQSRFVNKDFSIYSLDATTITVSLNLIPWAKYGKTKWAIKMHVLLNNQTLCPEVVRITDGKQADISVAKLLELEEKLEAGSFIVFDRGYLDYRRYEKFSEKWIFFVARAKKNMDYLVDEERSIENKGIRWVQRDTVIEVFNPTGNPYKGKLRLVHYISPDDGNEYYFLTNNFEITPENVALFYKNRRKIELFFKFIKQHLKIKSFLWTSENAVRNKLWVAMIYYLIVSYIKFKTNVNQELLTLCRLLSEALFLKLKIIDILGLSPQNLKQIVQYERDWPIQEPLF